MADILVHIESARRGALEHFRACARFRDSPMFSAIVRKAACRHGGLRLIANNRRMCRAIGAFLLTEKAVVARLSAYGNKKDRAGVAFWVAVGVDFFRFEEANGRLSFFATMLRWAATVGDLAAAKLVVSRIVPQSRIQDVVHATDDFALRMAAFFGHLDIVKYLVALGANVRAQNEYAMRVAFDHNHERVVAFLEALGASRPSKRRRIPWYLYGEFR